MTAALITLRHLSKSFAGVKAVDDAQFDLRPGEVHALMGENGAGKSTLMKLLAGIHQPDAGEILMEGRPITIRSPREAQALGIGIVHQELNLMNDLSAAQNIFIGREPRSHGGLFVDDARLDAMASALFLRIKLSIDPQVKVGALTVARQQIVEIAKALSFTHSRVLIMDEPTAALNPTEVADLFTVIRQLRAQGVGVVYISHKMDELAQIADRVTVMRDGRYVGTLPMAGTPMPTLIQMMVGRELAEPGEAKPDTSANEVVLEVRGLSGAALRGVSFQLRRGEILGFAGLMGAGRTETARAVFGADRITAGEIKVRGQTVRIRSPQDAVRLRIGYLSEDRKQFGLALGLDVQTNIALPNMRRFLRWRSWIDSRQIRRAAEGFVRQLQIKTASVEQPAGLLSGGNQQKIVIAKWLLRDCDILFFDEPTRGIDVGAKAEIYRLLNALAAEGKAIVMISSELPEVLRLSHRVLVMCEGRVTGELSAADATPEKIMALATQRGAV